MQVYSRWDNSLSVHIPETTGKILKNQNVREKKAYMVTYPAFPSSITNLLVQVSNLAFLDGQDFSRYLF